MLCYFKLKGGVGVTVVLCYFRLKGGGVGVTVVKRGDKGYCSAVLF